MNELIENKSIEDSLTKRWSKATIDKEKKKIRLEIDSVFQPKLKIRLIFEKIRGLENELSSVTQLKRYLYACYALMLHEKNGGLSEAEVRILGKMAFGSLRLQGISPGVSELSYLYRDLHLFISQIYRKMGNFWVSAWEQHLSHYVSKGSQSNNSEIQMMATAIRSLRLYSSDVAVQMFESVEKMSKGENHRARLGKINALRLSGKRAEAKAMITATESSTTLKEDERTELEWEKLCLEVSESHEVGRLVNAIHRGKKHHESSYIIDTYFWINATQDPRWIERYPTLKSLTRNRDLDFKKYSIYFKVAKIMKGFYDYSIPFQLRLKDAEAILIHARKCLSTEQEMLCWIALSRWLARSRKYDFATLVLSEYRGLSYRLSQGKCDDVFGVAQDLLTSNWFLERTTGVIEQNSTSDQKAA